MDLSDVDGAFAIFEKRGVVTAEHVLSESLVAALREAADESLARLEAEELAPRNLRVGDAYDLPCATHRPAPQVPGRLEVASSALRLEADLGR